MESGHNKNVANLQTVTIILNNLGGAYDPPQDLIKLPALQTLLTHAQTALAEVDAAQAAKAIAVDGVQAEFDGLSKYVVNIKRQAQVEINDPAFTNNLQTIVNNFSTSGRKPDVPDDPAAPGKPRTSRSQSQRSRDNQIAYLADVSALLKTNPDYEAGGTPYDIAAIDAKIASLSAKNNNAASAAAALGSKLDARDAVIYNNETGIVPRIILIKTYIALKFGKTSAPYQQINALDFRKVK